MRSFFWESTFLLSLRPMVFSLLIVTFLIGCEDSKTNMVKEKIPENTDIPDSIKALKNLTVITEGEEKPDSVKFVQEVVIKDSDATPINGFMRAAVVDSLDRLYIIVQDNRGSSSLSSFRRSIFVTQSRKLRLPVK